MSLFTSLIFLVFLFGSCTPQNTQDIILLTLEAIAQKIDGLENKLTLMEEEIQNCATHAEIDAFKSLFLTEQGNVKNSLQQCSTRDQITSFQDLIAEDDCEEGHRSCSASATCTDAIGQYKCVCMQGYSGDGFTCEDIDECRTNDAICGEGNTCINHPGTYGCLCADCQTELNKTREVLLDTINSGMDNLTSTTQEVLSEILEQKEAQCERKPIGSNCKELLDNGVISSGVYNITPKGFPGGVEVYCDQETDGGGWSVIFQRKKQTQQLSFVRTFEEYAAGFGDPNGEIWLGNRILHSMTGDQSFTLRVEAKNLQGESRTGIWHTFSVGSEDTQFTLSVADYSSSSSTLGEGLTASSTTNGMKFSTYDRDNDKASSFCSNRYGKGGWWYNGCYSGANPTAPFQDTSGSTAAKANWKFSSATHTAISEIQFKIRP